MQIVEKKELCNGCRACEQICPEKCIHMVRDEEGFLYPYIMQDKCIKCGKCKKICKAVELRSAENLKICYAARTKNNKICMNSSSGGVFYVFASEVIKKGGVVCGAVYDENYYVYHKFAESIDDLWDMMGSKYAQSDTKNTYEKVRDFLKDGRLCLYSGTPCQIAGLTSYLGYEDEKLICLSIICHGVPSPLVWEKYLDLQKGRYGEAKISKINCRDKYWGWRNCSLKIEFMKYTYHEVYTEDLFMQGFIENLYLRPSCYSCRAKGEKQRADIIIGDYWGIEEYHPELDDMRGVSAVIINSQKGKCFFDDVKREFKLVLSRYEDIMKENLVVEYSVDINEKRKEFFNEFNLTGQVDISIRDNLKEIVNESTRRHYQYPFIMKYLENKTQKKELCGFLNAIGLQKIALYAITEFTDLVYNDLFNSSSEIQIVYICDKNYRKFPNGFHLEKVIGIEELLKQYKDGKIDGVLNCSIFHENEVFRELISQGIQPKHIVSIVDCIYWGF